MVRRPFLITGIASLLVTIPALAAAAAVYCRAEASPPASERIAATTAVYKAIEAKIAARRSLIMPFPDPTAQEDIVDYGVSKLWKKGIDGTGVTVAYVVTNRDPGLRASMASYDRAMHLPPANIADRALPAPADPSAPCKVECSTGEDRLDAEAIHSMAPYANLLFVHPAVPETDGMQGWPEVAQAIKMIADRHLADIITVSLGDSENDFSNDPSNPAARQQAAIHSLDPAFLDAAARNIPVMFASGDCGPTGPPVEGSTGQCTPATGVTAGHAADSPWVTAVGGTVPNAGLATKSGRTAPDALWTAQDKHSDATSAGVSAVYAKPRWQRGIPALSDVAGRAFPDISIDAADGTSQASPTFAGILALATQLHGADLGTVNPALAALGPRGAKAGIVDVPAGYTNSAYGVTGFRTAKGYDIASGWGTVYAPPFVPALVRQIDQEAPAQPSFLARSLLNRLKSTISESVSTAASGQPITVTGRGFIPGRTPAGTTIREGFGVYPPLPGQDGAAHGRHAAARRSRVPGQTWDHVTATLTGPSTARRLAVTGPDGDGTVTTTIATRGMAAGAYQVTITGRLLTQTVSFHVQNPGFG